MNQIKNTGPSDMGVVKEGTINYIALPKLTGDYAETLKQLGTDCGRYATTTEQLGDPARYESSRKMLDAFERNMRRQFGVRVSREVILPVQEKM